MSMEVTTTSDEPAGKQIEFSARENDNQEQWFTIITNVCETVKGVLMCW